MRIRRKTQRRKQKMYKMKGCYKTRRRGGAGWLNSQGGGNTGSGLVGQSWNPNTWGASNHLELNTLSRGDVTRDMIATGAQPPFSVGGRRRRSKTQKRRQRGGTFSNFLNQDLFNVGRQFTYNLGGAYNGIRGYPPPVDPRPTSGQLRGSSYKL
jgi:hypothetical protein